MERRANNHDDGYSISWPSQSGITTWGLQQDFDKEHQRCFTRTAASYILGDLTFDQYLTAILLHLKQKSPAQHDTDELPKDMNPEIDLHPCQLVDIFGGSVKGLLWSPDFVPLTKKEFDTLKGLVTAAWASDNVDDFERSCQEQRLEISQLAPNVADLVLVACYARRHIELFTHLIGQLEAPSESSFDRLGGPVVETRNQVVQHHQHSPNSPHNAEIEARIWTLLLNSSWIHDPMDEMLRLTLGCHVPMVGSDERCMSYDSPVLEEYYAALSARNINPGISKMGYYLAECPSLELAQRFVTRFKVGLTDKWYAQASGNLLVKIVESERLNDTLRLEILKLVLSEVEGLNLDAFIDRPWVSEMRGWGAPKDPGDFFNALHAAAWNGKLEAAELLVEHGASVDVQDPDTKKTAEELARERGFWEIASFLHQVKRSGTAEAV